MSLIRNQPPSKVKQKVMIKYTITYLGSCQEDFDPMFGIKYLEMWTSVFKIVILQKSS